MKSALISITIAEDALLLLAAALIAGGGFSELLATSIYVIMTITLLKAVAARAGIFVARIAERQEVATFLGVGLGFAFLGTMLGLSPLLGSLRRWPSALKSRH